MIFSYSLAEDSQNYRQVLFDVFRIFSPMFQWEPMQTKENTVCVRRGETQWTLCLGAAEDSFSVVGLDENARRRRLKQVLYRMLSRQTGQQGHPWGILTGIRPTKIVHRCWAQGQTEETIRQQLQKEYLVAAEKADLLLDVTKRQRAFFAAHPEKQRAVSLYLSIPFCPTRCAYCSFPSFCLPKQPLQEAYLNDLLQECQCVGELLREKKIAIQTIYIGGGTPTSLSAVQLERLLQGIHRYFGWQTWEEFTVEAGRPDTITREKLQCLKAYQVNRISINPQTFSQATLDRIGRHHMVAQIFETYDLARTMGFASINMDLISGLPGETVADFRYSLQQVARLQPENLTVHALAVKRTSAMKDIVISAQHSETVRQMHRCLAQWVHTQSYVPYYLYRQKHMAGEQENVGYCLPGKESMYNIQMMEERQTILGLGVGSASKFVHREDGTLTQSNNPKDLYYYSQRLPECIFKKQQQIEELFAATEPEKYGLKAARRAPQFSKR